MHYHCEIVLPPDTKDIEAAVASIMVPFSENTEGEDALPSFWDWYVIGGRWAGSKLMAQYDKAKIEEFEKWMQDEKITVSGFQSGKQELSPASQIAKVDSKWNELFPPDNGVMVACPMFNHSNDQYGRNGQGTIKGDICSLKDATNVTCSRVIFGGPSYNSESGNRDGQLEAVYMLSEDFWNGVNHVDTKWDGTIINAVQEWANRLSSYKDKYRQQMTPTDEWITVTVDYHS